MDGSPTETRQPKQARAIRTRERILEQAEEAFAAKGFEAASLTSDILEPAGISVGSFYHQFPDKRAVLGAMMGERRRAWGAHVNAMVEDEQLVTIDIVLRDVLSWLLDDVDQRPAPWWVHFREVNHADPDIRGLVEPEWQAWIEIVTGLAGRFSSSEVELGRWQATFLACGLSGFVRRYLSADEADRTLMRETGVDETVQLFVASLDGIVPRPS